MSQTLRGVVKWFNDAKGFGFIEHESGKDVFVHYSVIEADGFKSLKDGEEVEYELKEGEKGLHAARVLRVNAPVKPVPLRAPQAGATTMIEVERLAEEGLPNEPGFIATEMPLENREKNLE